MKKILFLVAFAMNCSSYLWAQVRVRDVFAAAPDSIFPLLTQNNRLDCLDFMENNMPAKVKNRLDTYTEMTHLTPLYLRIEMTPRSTVQMRMLNEEGLFCLITTYKGPAADSNIQYFNAKWQPVALDAPVPDIQEFWDDVPDSLRQVAHFAQMSQADLPLMQMDANQEESPTLTITVQTSELAEEEQTTASQYTHSILYRWEEDHWER